MTPHGAAQSWFNNLLLDLLEQLFLGWVLLASLEIGLINEYQFILSATQLLCSRLDKIMTWKPIMRTRQPCGC